MGDNIVSYRKLGGFLLVIFIFGSLNAIGDISLLIQAATNNENSLFSRIFFSIFQNRKIFFIIMPLTLFCNILFVTSVIIRRLFLFKVSFFAACLIALAHLLVSLIALYPTTIFDIWGSANIYDLFGGFSGLMPIPLRSIYPAFLIAGTFLSLCILFVCFLYFKRSKRIAVYFDSKYAV